MVQLQVMKPALCTGRVLVLVPHIALAFGVAEGLVYWQLAFLATNGHPHNPTSVRVSYTRLQSHFPFFTRRWLIEIVRRLETRKAITVTRTGRVNRIALIGEYIIGPEPTESTSANMLVFPE